MRKALGLAILLALASCDNSLPVGADGVAWEGRWVANKNPGMAEMFVALSRDGEWISGDGIEYQAGVTRTFKVQGAAQVLPGPHVSFVYSDGSSVTWFGYGQPDTDHLNLYAFPGPELDFTRQ